MKNTEQKVRLDLNNPTFQEHLFALGKQDRLVTLDTLNKIRQLTWDQVYRDQGLKWEKIISVKPAKGIAAIYSLRISQSRRAVAYRDGEFMRFLLIPTDHDATYQNR